jgi:hypothetical protein
LADYWNFGRLLEFRQITGISADYWNFGRLLEFRQITGILAISQYKTPTTKIFLNC